MSDGPPRGPLFPPRVEPKVEEANPSPPPPAAPPPAPPPGIDPNLAVKVERAVVDTFTKHFGQSVMSYTQARILFRAEMELVGEVVRSLVSKAP